jgi:hypothetical protein
LDDEPMDDDVKAEEEVEDFFFLSLSLSFGTGGT